MIDTSQMDTFAVDCGAAPVTARVSRFQGENGATEWHMVICPTEYGTIGDQLTWIQRAYQSTLTTLGIDEQSAVFRRFFCSDLANQAPALEARPFSSRRDTDTPCAISWICQTPTGPAKVALWAYHLKDAGAALDKTKDGSTMALRRGPLTHYWTTGETFIDAGASYAQTRGVLENYDAFLTAKGMTMAHNVMRTWFFVQNIDADYTGLVTVRREFFESRGLTRKTHFISSTGIEGAYANTAAKITLDAYAIAGVQQEHLQFLNAPDHLCPADQYGVTFERGIAVAYRDRKHVIVSGTASIDSHGDIVYPGSIARQLDRTLDNVDALLRSAGATLNDMGLFVVYVRDSSDAAFVELRMRERVGDAPVQVVAAPVCRPGWLVEVEGYAIIPSANPGAPAF